MPRLLIFSKHADEYRQRVEKAELADLELFTATNASEAVATCAECEIVTSVPSFPADITQMFVENYHRFINGQALKYQVDFERGY